MTNETHRTSVLLWSNDRHQADCTCGWLGRSRYTRHEALADADAHTERQRIALAEPTR